MLFSSRSLCLLPASLCSGSFLGNSRKLRILNVTTGWRCLSANSSVPASLLCPVEPHWGSSSCRGAPFLLPGCEWKCTQAGSRWSGHRSPKQYQRHKGGSTDWVRGSTACAWLGPRLPELIVGEKRRIKWVNLYEMLPRESGARHVLCQQGKAPLEILLSAPCTNSSAPSCTYVDHMYTYAHMRVHVFLKPRSKAFWYIFELSLAV